MSDELVLEGREYISAKRASDETGYARDYIGQLARTGAIDAQRVGALWYVSMNSLNAYRKNADAYAPSPPRIRAPELDTVISLDGNDYISASRAAKITGYNQDYVGQLARSSKILSRQIGNRWYVEKASLMNHKSAKDALLASVQAESVGLRGIAEATAPRDGAASPTSRRELLNYFQESHDLMPVLPKRSAGETALRAEKARGQERIVETRIPIHIVRHTSSAPTQHQSHHTSHRRIHGKTIYRAAEAAIAFTFVIVLSYGLITFRDTDTYATLLRSSWFGGDQYSSPYSSTQIASVAESAAYSKLFNLLNALLNEEHTYKRVE